MMRMNDFEDNLLEIKEPTKIFLSLKADDTDKNRKIHEAFRDMAETEFPKCHDNYTLALGKLLDYYDSDSKTEMLWNEIGNLSERVNELEHKTREPEKKGREPF